MPFDTEGNWKPNTSEKQDFVRSMCLSKKYILLSGPRLSGKTVSALHAFVNHAWLTPKANNCIITISQTVGFDSGIWRDLTEVVIPEWIEGDFGLLWAEKPYVVGVSKKPACEIVNVVGSGIAVPDKKDPTKCGNVDEVRKIGGVSIIQLESLKVEAEVEARFKPRRYSGIYVPELTTFTNRHTFDTWSECLRLLGLSPDKHLFLADTNPDSPEHWVHKVWFELLDCEPDQVKPEEKAIRDQLARIDFSLADNIWDPPQRIEELKARYFHDPDLYARYIDGLWTDASADAIFTNVFVPNIHVQGEKLTPANPFPVELVPEDNCLTLYTGWDLGVTNSAAVIAEKPYRIAMVRNPNFPSKLNAQPNPPEFIEREIPLFKFLDELVVTGQVFTMEEFVLEFIEKMKFWEEVCGKPGGIKWVNWSDRSAFDFRDPVTSRYHHQIVYDASGGRIVLQAAAKGPGTVPEGVDLWKKLLFENRLFFSAARCPKLIQMNKSIKAKKGINGTAKIDTVDPRSPHKHIFDAPRYLVASEVPEELQRRVVEDFLSQRRTGHARSVAIPL